tara:strand:- start:2546 stop:2989 length:444 start_codon:yes stop_codon:yes gene_type:complete
VKKKIDTKKYQQFKDEIKTELETVYITTSGDRFLKKMDAVSCQAQIQQARDSKEKRRKIMMSMVEILIRVLKENNWGVFYKSEPMQTLTLQNDSPLLRINEVDDDVVEGAVLSVIENLKTKELTDWTKKEKEDTTPPSPTDSSQTKS